MKTTIDETLFIAKALSFVLLLITPLTAMAQPSVIGPYTLRIFALGPSDIGATKPDSITVDGQRNVWVSFTNGVAPDGSDGRSSTVVEYNPNGVIIGRIYSILGSNDGLKYNPCSKTIWALRNQDANPALTVIFPRTQSTKNYTYATVPAHGGGFDDVVFLGGKKYISASNPTLDPQGLNPAPSILSVRRENNTVFTTPVLSGDAFAINRVTGQLVQTVQTDPDSMTVDNLGNLVLDSQADSILLFVSNPGTPAQSVSELPLTDAGGNPVTVDDTVFPSTSSGTIYFTDSGTNTIYALQSDSFDINVGYSSSGPSIGTVNLSTGLYTPIVTGLSSSHGAIFVSAAGPDFQNDCSGDDGEPGGVGATVSDFNGNGHPDYVVQNASTHQTAIWYLNNNVYVGGAYGPTLAAGWGLRGVSDFNRDSHPDYALFAPSTNQTVLWYLSGPSFIGGAYGPTLPSGWALVGTADFNGDGYPDYVLYNASTRQTAVWYLNNNVVAGGGYGPTLPPGWDLIGVADFNGDGHPDYALFNYTTGQTAIWYLSGPTLIGGAFGPTPPSGWALVATADFNGDGKPDYVLYDAGTRQTAIWYLNNNVFVSGAYGPTLPFGWSLVAP